jgi:hypothetical protein
MKSRLEQAFSAESRAKAAEFEAILSGAAQEEGAVLTLSDADLHCCNQDQWMRLGCNMLRALQCALQRGSIKPHTCIQLTGNVNALNFADLRVFEQYVMQHGVPHGMKLSIAVHHDTHPTIKRKAVMLERMFAHSDPLAHLKAYLSDPQPDIQLYVTHEMRHMYQLETKNNLVSELIKLISSGKMTSFTRIHLEDFTLANADEAKSIIGAVRQCKRIPEKFEIFISTRCGLPVLPGFGDATNNISALQAELYDLFIAAERKRVEDNEVAFAAFMASGVFDSKFQEDGIVKVVTQKAVAARLFSYVNPAHQEPYKKAATLQHDRVRDRALEARTRRYWSFFYIGAAVAAVVVPTVLAVKAYKSTE